MTRWDGWSSYEAPHPGPGYFGNENVDRVVDRAPNTTERNDK